MDSSSFTGLLNNTAIMLALGVIYDALGLHAIKNPVRRQVATGLLIGTLGIAIMYTPWELMPGVFFDTRWVLISLSALFFGVGPTLIVVTMTVSFRVFQGGAGIYVGSLVIIVPALIGLGWRHASGRLRLPLDARRLFFFGVVIQLSVLACFFLLPEGIRYRTIAAVGPPMLLIFPVATMLLGLMLRHQQDRLQAERELQIRQRQLDRERSLLRGLIDAVPDLIFFKDINGLFLGCNRAFERYIGCKEEQLLGRRPQEITADINADFRRREDDQIAAGEAKAQYEEEAVYPDGKQVVLDTMKARFFSATEGAQGIVSISHDITARKEAEEKIRTLAFYDSLTGLPNRRLLLDRLKMKLASSRRSKTWGAIIFIDLDHFKDINDTQGHYFGDQLLIEVSQRLQRNLRTEDTASRLGGDEFVVMIDVISEDETTAARVAEEIADKLLSALAEVYELHGADEHTGTEPNRHYCTASMGISLFSDSTRSEDEVLKQADAAMYQAKSSGRNTIRFFDPNMQRAMEQSLALQADLRDALDNGELELYYQAQVDEQSGIRGAEALLRWNHPDRGMLFPDSFITLAEDTGLIVPIGDWVLRSACRQLKQWSAQGHLQHLQIAVNVSARQFRKPSFADDVREAIISSEVEPSRLKLELTESLVFDDVEGAIDRLHQLTELGVRFSMDDFGTGQSSLSNLKRLPLAELKIDRSFTRDITTDPGDAAIVQAIIGLSESLSLKVIAEGVETEEQRRFLREHGCSHYQGYLFSRPIPLADFEALLAGEAEVTAFAVEGAAEVRRGKRSAGSADTRHM